MFPINAIKGEERPVFLREAVLNQKLSEHLQRNYIYGSEEFLAITILLVFVVVWLTRAIVYTVIYV